VDADVAALESLYPEAFPDEELLPLVGDLLDDPEIALSLVATIGSQVVGHVILTRCSVYGYDAGAALLGPLAVTPALQRQGIGSAIVSAALHRLNDEGTGLVCVLGDPAYYGRHGFSSETRVDPPYTLPAEWADAWQSLYLGAGEQRCDGTLSVPPQWRQRALWAP
jgi:putative acetyltransferase